MLRPDFTVKPKTVEDTKPEAERIRYQKCPPRPAPDSTAVTVINRAGLKVTTRAGYWAVQ